MKKLFTLIVICFYLTVGIHAQSAKDGLRFLEVGMYQKGKKTFQDLYKSNPSSDNDYYLGNYYATIGKTDSAKTYFQQGINKDPKNAYNYIGLGKLLYTQNTSEGRNNLQRAQEIVSPKNTEQVVALAQAFISVDKLEVPEAFKVLDAAAKHAATNPEIAITRGDGYLKIGDPTKAVGSYEEALKLNPSYPKTLVKLGDIYQRVQNQNLAIEYYQKAIAADSLYAPAYRELGDASYKKKDYDKAFAYYKKYVALADEDETTASRYAYFLVLSKDYNKAISTLQPFTNKEKVSPTIYRLLAVSYYETEQYDEGMNQMQKYWSIADPKKYDASDYEYYGKLLLKNDQDSLAVVNLEKALSMDSSRKELYGDLGLAYLTTKKYDKAEAALTKKIAFKSTAFDYYNLGKACFKLKKFEKADTAFGSLIALAPTFAQGYFWKADTKSRLDPESTKGLAKPYFEKFIDLTKNDVEKNKKDLIEAYQYLGYYYLLKKDKPSAKEAYLKLKAIDPNNANAEKGLKIVNGAK
jgi:tetratricopeptide (TPR) repeat protein